VFDFLRINPVTKRWDIPVSGKQDGVETHTRHFRRVRLVVRGEDVVEQQCIVAISEVQNGLAMVRIGEGDKSTFAQDYDMRPDGAALPATQS
jgi:hypothetical protein